MSLLDIYEDYRSDAAFDHLRTAGTILVPGEGSSRPKVLIVGEAPGATENTLRRPFVGASGRVLRSMITDCAMLEPADYFITNTVKYRPAGNRTPELSEIANSRAYLRREWSALGRPPVLVAVGAVAKAALAPDLPGVLQIAGVPHRRPQGGFVFVMIHPAYGLRNPAMRPLMEEHWTKLGEFVRGLG